MDGQPPERLSRLPLMLILFSLAALCLWLAVSLSASERPLADASVAAPQPLNPL